MWLDPWRDDNGYVHNKQGIIFDSLNPLSASFYIPENTIDFPTTKCFRRKITTKLSYQYMTIFHPHQIIFIHYKLRIAEAIRSL